MPRFVHGATHPRQIRTVFLWYCECLGRKIAWTTQNLGHAFGLSPPGNLDSKEWRICIASVRQQLIIVAFQAAGATSGPNVINLLNTNLPCLSDALDIAHTDASPRCQRSRRI